MGLMKFTGFALKNLFSKPATSNYPFEPAVYPEASRGHIEIDIDDCIMCGMCQRKCPSDAIKVDKATRTWSIERMGCVQCENCVNGCPKKCLSIKPGYSEPSATKTVDSYSQPIPEKPAKAESDNNSDAPALSSGKIVNDMNTCILCGLCARQCPAECITVDRNAKTWTINRDECMQCGACIEACKKFHSLSFAEDDGESGEVVLSKDGASAPAKPVAKPTPAPKKEEPKADTVIGKLSTQKPNPDMKFGKIANDIETCILCGLCARKCPLGLITVDRKDTKTWSIDRDSCLQCGMCVDACIKLHCLGYTDDDAEYGIVTYKKES